jgi:prevent-host-death family protein
MTIGAFEAKNKFSELLERVSNGEEIVITRHNQEVARLVPANRPSLQQIKAAIDGILELQKRCILNPRGKKKLTLKELREEGRP